MWCIAGSLPETDFALSLPHAPLRVQGDRLLLPDGRDVPVERGTAALAATATLACAALDTEAPCALLAGDIGRGDGSRQLYAWLAENAATLAPRGMTFHYLFPDVDGHNRVLMALQGLPRVPLMLADAGFMYAAKMSGYADAYDLFTPDVGELAFLADENAPHPFYTRGFLLAEEHNIPPLLQRVLSHGNCPRHLLIKGAADHVVCGTEVRAVVDSPSVPAMECIGGTGDIVTGLVTAFAAAGWPLCAASLAASRTARVLAAHCAPQPDTPVGDLILRLPEVLTPALQDQLRQEAAALWA